MAVLMVCYKLNRTSYMLVRQRLPWLAVKWCTTKHSVENAMQLNIYKLPILRMQCNWHHKVPQLDILRSMLAHIRLSQANIYIAMQYQCEMLIQLMLRIFHAKNILF